MIRKFSYLFLVLFVMVNLTLPVSEIQAQSKWPTDWDWSKNPVEILDTVKRNANAEKSEEVQNTQWDDVTSRYCLDLDSNSNFTITRTLCYLKNNSWNYLQYIMYAWLTLATILIIRNWFKLVTSPDREKQMTTFKKNILYITIWITLLLWFYYFLDIYVWVINLFSD